MAREALRAKIIASSTVDKNGCWIWNKSCNSRGYGCICFDRRCFSAHRLSYSVFVGEIPNGYFVCHHCDVPSCVNPSHLFSGTASDNMRDMVVKGHTHHYKRISAMRTQEQKSASAKLSEDGVSFARSLVASGVQQKEVAEILAVTPTCINDIIRGRTWKGFGLTTADLTVGDVCRELSVSRSWLEKHRNEFGFYRIPGRGRTGQSPRFTLRSVNEYRQRLLREAQERENPYRGKTIDEISAIVQAKHERERAGVTP